MSNAFNKTSKTSAQNFIQTVLFVDDNAYNDNRSNHPFDVKQAIQESAAKGFIATAYAPENQEDLKHIADVGKKADVIVLDWRMDVSDESDQAHDDEEDDVADHRGSFAINVINSILSNNGAEGLVDQVKLIFIYTGETGIQDICTRLQEEFDQFEKLDEFTLLCGGIRISIWAKEILASSFSHLPENKQRLRSYTQLLDEISKEYSTNFTFNKNSTRK